LDFNPSINGLHYANAWSNVPDLQVPTPFGSIGLGSAANGLCGGMTFAVRDLFESGRLPPTGTTPPAAGSPAFSFVVSRLLDSFNIPSGVAQYFEWMNLPTHDTLLGPAGTSHRTINDSMPIVRQTIDGGAPCPLGLVCVHSQNPLDLGQNHQVLAYRYEEDGVNTTVWVYDPNWPNKDDVCIRFNHTNPGHTTDFAYSTSDHNILGFFTVPYVHKDPSDLFQES
jgi:hypothetical protein